MFLVGNKKLHNTARLLTTQRCADLQQWRTIVCRVLGGILLAGWSDINKIVVFCPAVVLTTKSEVCLMFDSGYNSMSISSRGLLQKKPFEHSDMHFDMYHFFGPRACVCLL